MNSDEENIRHLRSIINEEDFEPFITEAYNVPSICKVLYMLTHPSSTIIFMNEQKYNRFAFSMMAEAVMRSARTYLKSTKLDQFERIRRILGIEDGTQEKDYKFDIEKAKLATGKFYSSRYSNCSPFALVGTLGLIDQFHLGISVEEITNKLLDGNISMKSFLERHLTKANGSVTQIALLLQGIKFHKSKYRQNFKFTDPERIVYTMIEEQLEIVKERRLFMARMEKKRGKRD